MVTSREPTEEAYNKCKAKCSHVSQMQFAETLFAIDSKTQHLLPNKGFYDEDSLGVHDWKFVLPQHPLI